MPKIDPITSKRINELLTQLARLFKPDRECTFIMRTPGDQDCELVASNDDLDEVIKVLERMKRQRGERCTKV
jgi:hypothetical protein